jgi:hypothetical protein
MKSITVFLATALLAVATTQAMAHESHGAGHGMGAHMGAAGAQKTITGEVVDTGCYIAHSARGEKHVSCATKCINQGMPMGLLTSDGTLYLVTLNHDNADPYNHLKAMAGKTVSVTGTVMARSGMKAIDVTEFKSAAQATRR